MNDAQDLLLRAEEALIGVLGGNTPDNQTILKLLEDISRWLEQKDAERNQSSARARRLRWLGLLHNPT